MQNSLIKLAKLGSISDELGLFNIANHLDICLDSIVKFNKTKQHVNSLKKYALVGDENLSNETTEQLLEAHNNSGKKFYDKATAIKIIRSLTGLSNGSKNSIITELKNETSSRKAKDTVDKAVYRAKLKNDLDNNGAEPVAELDEEEIINSLPGLDKKVKDYFRALLAAEPSEDKKANIVNEAKEVSSKLLATKKQKAAPKQKEVLQPKTAPREAQPVIQPKQPIKNNPLPQQVSGGKNAIDVMNKFISSLDKGIKNIEETYKWMQGKLNTSISFLDQVARSSSNEEEKTMALNALNFLTQDQGVKNATSMDVETAQNIETIKEQISLIVSNSGGNNASQFMGNWLQQQGEGYSQSEETTQHIPAEVKTPAPVQPSKSPNTQNNLIGKPRLIPNASRVDKNWFKKLSNRIEGKILN